MNENRRLYYPANRVIAGAIMGIMLSCFSTVVAQQKKVIDVKTSFAEKRELSPIKHGVITAINASNWAKVEELGETWTLWIADYARVPLQKDSLKVQVLLELRGPSFLRRGKLIKSQQFEIRYSLRDTARNVDAVTFEYLEKQKLWGRILAVADLALLFNQAGAAAAVASAGQDQQAQSASKGVSNLLSQILPNPSKTMLLEGSLVWGSVAPAIRAMCLNAPASVPNNVKPWGSK